LSACSVATTPSERLLTALRLESPAAHDQGGRRADRGSRGAAASGRHCNIGEAVRPFIRVNVLAVRVDSQNELVVAADIAERLGLSRARVSVLVSNPGFPRPLGRLGRSDVWRWSAVERWARQTGRLQPAE
jgi:predicted DNA-binding transcriptional regulator AlpA